MKPEDIEAYCFRNGPLCIWISPERGIRFYDFLNFYLRRSKILLIVEHAEHVYGITFSFFPRAGCANHFAEWQVRRFRSYCRRQKLDTTKPGKGANLQALPIVQNRR